VAVTLAGGGPAAAGALPDSGELLCLSTALGECDYVDPASGLLVRWPSDWPSRRLKLVTESGPTARARHRDAIRWIAIEYVPDDVALPEASLFCVAVLRRPDWLAQAAQSGPADGIEVAARSGHVAVAILPPGSRDADIFDALTPSLAEISRIVRIPAQRRVTQ
jgi:hypothetical protein